MRRSVTCIRYLVLTTGDAFVEMSPRDISEMMAQGFRLTVRIIPAAFPRH